MWQSVLVKGIMTREQAGCVLHDFSFTRILCGCGRWRQGRQVLLPAILGDSPLVSRLPVAFSRRVCYHNVY